MACIAQLDAPRWQLDLLAVAFEPWRWLTGHLVHWDRSHFAYDLLAFLMLGAMAEQFSRRRMLAAMLLAAVVGSIAFAWFHPDLLRYRGLSGIDSALFVVVLLGIARRSRWGAATTIAGIMGLALKIGYELVQQQTVFAASSEWTNVPIVHLVGACVGLIVGGAVTRDGSRAAGPQGPRSGWGRPRRCAAPPC